MTINKSELKANILLFQRVLPAYRVSLFEKLYKNFGIITCYSNTGEYLNKTNLEPDIQSFTKIIRSIKCGKSPTAIIQNPFPVFFKFKPEIVISEGSPSYLTLWLILFARRIFRYKLVIWSHGIRYNELYNPFNTFRSKIQLWLFNKADAVLTYSDKRAEILKKYVNYPEKIFVARNTLDTEINKNILNGLLVKDKCNIKKELNFMHKFNLIYSGRLVLAKKLNELLEAFFILEKDFDIALHIVGDGPEKEKFMGKSLPNTNIIYYGSIFDPEVIGKMIYVSDLMVNPGYVGLSVVHAFSFGCPIITYKDGPVHSPEVEYIKHLQNGVFCIPDPQSLAETITFLLKNPETIRRMSEEALNTAYNEADIRYFIKGFSGAINFLENPSQ